MISLHLTRGDNYEGVYLQLPTTPAEVGEAYAMLDSISRHAGETRIVDVKGPVKNLAQFIKCADLATYGLFSGISTKAPPGSGLLA